jgi:hypothetical protein
MIRALTASDILSLWEQGRDRRPADRALLVLRAACPGPPDDTLAALTIGQRDARLFAARAATLGKRIDGSAACPSCAEALEFSIDTGDLCDHSEPSDERAPIEFDSGGIHIVVRPPDSRDLVAIGDAAGIDAARRQLLHRCLVTSLRGGHTVDPSELPPAVVERIAALLADADPQADVTLEIRCGACGHSWPLLFDIATFFWLEIEALAARLVADVDALARAYGWREADILAMSGTRRSAYLAMVT